MANGSREGKMAANAFLTRIMPSPFSANPLSPAKCFPIAISINQKYCYKIGFHSGAALTKDVLRKIWPLPLFYIGNMLFGLGGTKELSLPMMTVLRRFSILMTMIGEFYLLKVNPDIKVQLSVYLMIFGAIVAACNDLAFSPMVIMTHLKLLVFLRLDFLFCNFFIVSLLEIHGLD